MSDQYHIRIFNERGLAEFSGYLEQLREGKQEEFSKSLLYDNEYTDMAGLQRTYVPLMVFKSKLEAARILAPAIKNLDLGDKFFNRQLWAWLSAFYIDSVCPIIKGVRKPGEIYRHIPAPELNWQKYYRHLLAFPSLIYDIHGEKSKVLLHGSTHEGGDFIGQLGSRQEIAMNPGILEVVDILYWDEAKQKPKVGALDTKNRPGRLRRFVNLINQFNQTYDLFSMNGKEILALLPATEFNAWME